jgi:predicted permease
MSLVRRIGNLFRRRSLESEIDAEIRAHIEMRTQDNVAAGMPLAEAQRDAMVRFGGRTAMKERVTGADAALVLESVWSDLRYACRQLRKNPGFGVTAISVLALGICASVAIFAFVDAVLIKPLPYRNPVRLVGLFESTPMGPRYHLAYLDYLDWKKMNKAFSGVEAYDNSPFGVSTPGGIQRADGAVVSAGFFDLLGVRPVLGRDLHTGEDVQGAPRVVLLSYAAWQNRYGGRQEILGQSVTLDGRVHVIVGILPKEFSFPPAGPAEFWTALQTSTKPEDRGWHWLSAIARLKDGVSFEAAAADVTSIADRLAKEYADSDGGRGGTVVPLGETITGNLRPLLWLLLSGAALLLLIACINVSSLLLVRSENRRREISLRGALGAGRARLTRQFAIEGLTLAAAGSVLGVGSAYGAMRLLTLLIPANMLANMPYLHGLGMSWHVACFAGLIGLMTAILFSVTPLLRLPSMGLQSSFREGLAEGGRSAAGTVWRDLGAKLVIAELCTAMVLLVGAGLLGKSFYKLLHTDIGLQPDHLAMLRVRAPHAGYSKDEQLVALTHRVTAEVKGLPGVQSAAVTHQIPVAGVAGGNTTFLVVGRPELGQRNEANQRQIGAGYFNTVGARLMRGRYFTDGDNASKPRVMVVNETFAKRYFPGEDAIGKEIRFDSSAPPVQVVGVVQDIQEGPLDGEVHPALYTPYDQGPDDSFYVVVRTAQAPETVLKTLEGTIHRIDPEILTLSAETMPGRINDSQAAYLHRSSAWLAGGFAAIALLLGVVGLYGVIAYSVSQRTREIGVRMALGAERGAVYRLILREAGKLTGVGVVAGLGCSLAAAALMRSLLFGTQPWDVSTLVAVSMMMAASAMLASYFPARRAASVDPVEALRAE